MNKKIWIIVIFLLILSASYWIWRQARINPGYYGLPAVACVDPTRPLIQNFTFNIKITIDGKNFPIDSAIGHDPGKCLRAIHTEDSSGKVLITSNNTITYTLQDFFNVWHKNFTPSELMGYLAVNGRKISVYVNRKAVSTANQTPVRPNDFIEIVYQ